MSRNSVIHIYSVVAHDFMRVKETLLPYPYMQHNCKYYIHEALQNFYEFQIGNLVIHQTFCFVNCKLYI